MTNPTEQQVPADVVRRLLLGATATLGTTAGVATVVPFVASMAAGQRALSEGAPVDVNLDTIAPGEVISVARRGNPFSLLHRTLAMIESPRHHTEMSSDPLSNRSEQPGNGDNVLRCVKHEFVVLTGTCTHLGCKTFFRPDLAPADLGKTWCGGFYCPCHDSKFDSTGWLFKNVPARLNLVVPPHQSLTGSLLRVGEST
jgi:ubiquinol-cytochrome c reductase iron-sulfur subunit